MEGLNSLGYLSNSDYEVYKSKYSVGLEEAANAPTPAQIREQETRHNKNRQLNRHFSEVNKQWSNLKDSAKSYHIKDAQKHKTLKMAKYVLDLAKQEGLI